MKEPFLEPVLRNLRIRKVLPTLRQYQNCRLLDIGCGWNFQFLMSVEPYITEGVGIDFKVREVQTRKIKTKQAVLDQNLPFSEKTFDVVTMLAVLEHLEKPVEMIREIERVLKPLGRLILTVPSRRAKPVLEFLAYQLKIVSEEEIKDHKKYYNYEDILDLSSFTQSLKVERHQYFQFGMNNFCVFVKNGMGP